MTIIIIPLILGLIAATSADEIALQEFKNGNNLFTAHAYKEASKENPSNFIVSPFSAETVLALTQSGAKDATKYEILAGLSLPNSTSKTEAAFQALLPNIHGNELYKLHAANKIYVQANYPIRDDFARLAKDVYQAETENINFAEQSESAQKINTWVENETDGKIRDFISSDSVGGDTRIVLVDALYFKGKWLYPFNPSQNTEKEFFLSENKAVKVEMMCSKKEYFKYYDSAELKARYLELPFAGGDVSLVIVLPNEKEGLNKLETQLEKVLNEPKFVEERVDVLLPKFSVENKVNFKSILENLGIKKVFSPLQADLSGIAGEKGDLFVSDVLQKSFINVTEIGTEATAATAVFVELESLPSPGKYTFDVDRPFLFYLKAKDIILLIGRVTEVGSNQ